MVKILVSMSMPIVHHVMATLDTGLVVYKAPFWLLQMYRPLLSMPAPPFLLSTVIWVPTECICTQVHQVPSSLMHKPFSDMRMRTWYQKHTMHTRWCLQHEKHDYITLYPEWMNHPLDFSAVTTADDSSSTISRYSAAWTLCQFFQIHCFTAKKTWVIE